MNYEELIFSWVKQDPVRLAALRQVSDGSEQEFWIAAGFIRNLVWDKLHHYANPTPLNDIDVIYYAFDNLDDITDRLYETKLNALSQNAFHFSVKNQARMHYKLGVRQYKNIPDALSFWPEVETAVCIRMDGENIRCIAPFGLEALFNNTITYNEKCSWDVFQDRLEKKCWVKQWPSLVVRGR